MLAVITRIQGTDCSGANRRLVPVAASVRVSREVDELSDPTLLGPAYSTASKSWASVEDLKNCNILPRKPFCHLALVVVLRRTGLNPGGIVIWRDCMISGDYQAD